MSLLPAIYRALDIPPGNIIGTTTLEKLKKADIPLVKTKLKKLRYAEYKEISERDPIQKVFLKGWLDRSSSC